MILLNRPLLENVLPSFFALIESHQLSLRKVQLT